jgi:hypothetical protein
MPATRVARKYATRSSSNSLDRPAPVWALSGKSWHHIPCRVADRGPHRPRATFSFLLFLSFHGMCTNCPSTHAPVLACPSTQPVNNARLATLPREWSGFVSALGLTYLILVLQVGRDEVGGEDCHSDPRVVEGEYCLAVVRSVLVRKRRIVPPHVRSRLQPIDLHISHYDCLASSFGRSDG